MVILVLNIINNPDLQYLNSEEKSKFSERAVYFLTILYLRVPYSAKQLKRQKP
jgi:hypothetical protein